MGIGGAVGPALDVEPGGAATAVNSTIADGLDIGIIDDGTLTLTNTTVTGNQPSSVGNSAAIAAIAQKLGA